MKTLCNNKSPLGVIGPVFHTVLVGNEVNTFFSDFNGPLIKAFQEKIDKKIKGYNLVQARVVSIPNSIDERHKAELVVFYKRDSKVERKDHPLDFKQNYEYIVFYMKKKEILAYGTNVKKFVDEFPVEASPFFTLPTPSHDWRSGRTSYYLTQPDPSVPRYEFIQNTYRTAPYFGNEESVEINWIRKSEKIDD